jgi:hypothetical protein
LSEHLTRIAASCESRGQSNEVERRLEAAKEDGAQALVLLGDIGAGKEAREYAKVLRTVGPSAAIRCPLPILSRTLMSRRCWSTSRRRRVSRTRRPEIVVASRHVLRAVFHSGPSSAS